MNVSTPINLDAVIAATDALRRAEVCLAGQKEAFESCLDGAPLATSLGILVRTAIEQADGEARAAFLLLMTAVHRCDISSGCPKIMPAALRALSSDRIQLRAGWLPIWANL